MVQTHFVADGNALPKDGAISITYHTLGCRMRSRAQSTRALYTPIGTGRVKIIHSAGTDSATAITLGMPWRRFTFIA